jgi:hypothetical protein
MGAFEDFLAEVGDGRSQACWLLELDALPLAVLTKSSAAFGDGGFGEYAFCEDEEGQSGGVVTLYYSSHGYISKATDTPANTWYDGRMSGDVLVERRIFDQKQGFGGLAFTRAELSLINNDGELDTLLRDYAIDGRAARALLGRPTDARSAFGEAFIGVVRHARVDSKRLGLTLSDGLARLELPINRNTYAGTGGIEGGADLKGKPKPKGWGHAFNINPPLVNSASLIYQVHDGAISDVPNAWDRQVALVKGADYASQADMEANAPAAGNYRVWKGGGFIRLGSTPAGTVTADLLGDASGAGYINKTGDIVNRILGDQALLLASEIDAAAIAQLNVDAPVEVGIWRGTEQSTIAGALDELLAGVGAFGGFSRLGKFTAGVIATPSGASVASYTEEEIGELERAPLPSAVEPIVWRARVGWQRNYTVQNDVAAGVTQARRTFAAEAERVAIREDTTIRSRRTLAREYGPTGNLYAQQADADTEAIRLMGLWGVERALYSVPLPAAALARDIGDVITVTYPRFGFSLGAQTRVLGHELQGTRVKLKVFA